MKHSWISAFLVWPGLVMAQEDQFWPDYDLIGLSTDIGASFIVQPDQPDIGGARIGLSGAILLNQSSERPLFLEFGLSHSNGSSQDRTSQMVAADIPFVFATRVTPTGNLSLNTLFDASGASATAIVSFTDTSGDSLSITSTTFSPPDGQTSVFATSPSEEGGAFTSVVTDGTAGIATAVGAFYDDSGAAFLGTGTGGDTSIATGRRDAVDFTDATLQLSSVFAVNDTWNMAPRVGLLLQRFDRSTTLSNTIDVADGFAAEQPTPDFVMTQATDLRSDMIGLSFGMGLSRQLSQDWYMSFGADLGTMYRKTDYTSQESVLFDQSQIQRISGPGGSDTGSANLARLSMGLSHQFAQGGIISVNIYADMLTDIPYLERVDLLAPAPMISGDDVTLDLSGQTNQDLRIRYGDLRNTGIMIGFLWAY